MADWRPIIKRRMNGTPRIMGIINITPDSFFKDSRVNDLDLIVDRAIAMSDNGADWIDIGGESTRPGAKHVTSKNEINRVSKAIELVRDALPDIGISIDTRKSEVADVALKNGANLINDVSGLMDDKMKEVVADYKCPICIMHMQGLPESMQINPKYGDVIDEIKLFLEKSNNELIDLGVSPELIINDPGIGFGKLLGHNIELLKSGRDILCDQKLSLMWGVSRKRMFADLLGRDETIDRLAGTLGVAAMALEKEVDIIRVHDVPEHRDLFETMKVIGG